jgi:hypothetical protein
MVSIRTVLYEQYKNEARYMKARVWREGGGGASAYHGCEEARLRLVLRRL